MASQVIPGLPVFQPARLNEQIDLHLLTNDEVAKRLGVSSKTVSRWRKGRNEPQRKIVRRMAEEFGVDPLSFYDFGLEEAA